MIKISSPFLDSLKNYVITQPMIISSFNLLPRRVCSIILRPSLSYPLPPSSLQKQPLSRPLNRWAPTKNKKCFNIQHKAGQSVRICLKYLNLCFHLRNLFPLCGKKSILAAKKRIGLVSKLFPGEVTLIMHTG